MTIYRGTGGGGNATTDSEIALLTQLEQSATAAAATASTAATTATTKAAEAAASAASISGDVADAEAARVAAEAAQEGAEEAQDAALAAQVAAEAAAEALDSVYTRAEADALLAAKATQATFTGISVTSGTWTGTDPSTAVVTVTGLLSTDRPIVDIDLSGVSFSSVEDVQADWGLVYRVAATANNQLTLFATAAPTNNFTLNAKVVR